MGSEEDAALLVLIHEHLKVSGYREAAQLLEEHLTQVEMPVESLNLHDIYTGWMKLCSLAQHAKQETEIDSGNLKTKVIKQEEEEAADVKLYSVAGDNKADDKPLTVSKMEVVALSTAETATETVSDQNLDAADKTQTGRSDGGASESSDSEVEEEWKKTSTDTKTVPTEASVVAPNEGKSSISASSDTERTSEPTQGDSDPINHSQPETQLRTSDPAEVSGSESEQEENKEEQEPQAVINSPEVTKETCASEPIDAVQVATVCSSQETNVAELLEEEEEQLTAAERSVHAESVSDPTVEDTSNQAAEREAPPPADEYSEIPQVVRFEKTEEEDELKTPVATEDQSDASDPPAPEAAEVQEDDDSCIILNIQTNEAAKQQPAELFGDRITARKKKKKSKKGSAETSWVDIAVTPSTDVAYTDTFSDSPLTSGSKKKKRKGKKRDEMANEEKNKNEVAEESQVAKPKKKAKKRKREDMEETIFPLENTSKKKKKKQQLTDGMKHTTEMTGMDEGNSGNSAETRLRKKKNKREELQFKEAPAEGEKEQTKDTADSNSSQLSSAKKKKHLRRKLSLKKRLKLRKKEMMRKAQSPNFHAGQTITGRKKQKQKETGKSPSPKTEINTEQEESSWKENQPPRRRKRRKSVMNILDAPEDESEFSKEKKEKKKKTKMGEISPPDTVTQLPPAKKKKKDRLKIQLEDTEAPPAVSEKKKKKNKTTKKLQ